MFSLNNICRTCIPFFVSHFEEIKVKNLWEIEVTIENKVAKRILWSALTEHFEINLFLIFHAYKTILIMIV